MFQAQREFFLAMMKLFSSILEGVVKVFLSKFGSKFQFSHLDF